MSRRTRTAFPSTDDVSLDPSPATGDEAVDNQYAHLVERASSFVREQGGAVSEEGLIGHVFGTMGTPDLWRPLLRRILGAGDELVLRPDGCWAVPGVAMTTSDSLLSEFVAV